MCRECIREPRWQDKIRLARVKNHFICNEYFLCSYELVSVESTGIYNAGDLFAEAVRVLIRKCETIEEELQKLSKSV